MTVDEFANFLRNGGKINYGAARLARQLQLDERYERRRRRHDDLFDLVVDVLACWDPINYIERNRQTLRNILALPRNARRRQLSGLATKARRHQAAVRLVHGMAVYGLSQAQYCRRHKLDRADTSRMLEHLCEKEPGLRVAVEAISACAATISWQNQQQQRKLRNRVRLIYGWNFDDVADDGWQTDYSAGGIRSMYGGRFKPTALLRDEPFKPLDLHEPSTWHGLVDSYPDWGALSEPIRVVARYEAPPNRYRPIRRAVRLKSNRRQTLDIARVLDASAKALVYWPRHAWPATNILDRLRRLAIYLSGWTVIPTLKAVALRTLGLDAVSKTASAATLRGGNSLNDETVFLPHP